MRPPGNSHSPRSFSNRTISPVGAERTPLIDTGNMESYKITKAAGDTGARLSDHPGYGSCRAIEPVSSRDFRLERIFGQPPDTAAMNFEGSCSIV